MNFIKNFFKKKEVPTHIYLITCRTCKEQFASIASPIGFFYSISHKVEQTKCPHCGGLYGFVTKIPLVKT